MTPVVDFQFSCAYEEVAEVATHGVVVPVPGHGRLLDLHGPTPWRRRGTCLRSPLATCRAPSVATEMVFRLSPVHRLPLAPATSALASTLAPAAPVHRLQQATASGYSHVSFSISELSNSRGFISTLRKHTT
jgi:hypothetical protein